MCTCVLVYVCLWLDVGVIQVLSGISKHILNALLVFLDSQNDILEMIMLISSERKRENKNREEIGISRMKLRYTFIFFSDFVFPFILPVLPFSVS